MLRWRLSAASLSWIISQWRVASDRLFSEARGRKRPEECHSTLERVLRVARAWARGACATAWSAAGPFLSPLYGDALSSALALLWCQRMQRWYGLCGDLVDTWCTDEAVAHAPEATKVMAVLSDMALANQGWARLEEISISAPAPSCDSSARRQEHTYVTCWS